MMKVKHRPTKKREAATQTAKKARNGPKQDKHPNTDAEASPGCELFPKKIAKRKKKLFDGTPDF